MRGFEGIDVLNADESFFQCVGRSCYFKRRVAIERRTQEKQLQQTERLLRERRWYFKAGSSAENGVG